MAPRPSPRDNAQGGRRPKKRRTRRLLRRERRGPPEPPSDREVERAPRAGLRRGRDLIAGIDRTRSGGFGRTDTLVVALFDDATGHVGLVSIPRDLLVDVPGHGLARINATLRIASRLGVDPVATLRRVVGDVLGFEIDHAILGDLDVFEQTVDALGGVEVDVPCPMVDDFLDPRTESGRRVLRVDAGRVRMDGATAAMYARSRHGRSDWDRARRQQALLFAMRGRVRELGAAAWLPVLRTASEHVTTDLTRLELLALVRRVASVREERLHGILLGHREVIPAAPRKASGWCGPTKPPSRVRSKGSSTPPRRQRHTHAPGAKRSTPRCVRAKRRRTNDAPRPERTDARIAGGGVARYACQSHGTWLAAPTASASQRLVL
ncbi:MAG: LCP family protein [Sandaracinus sp.]|nr:LCP family protein [Sandaracinus sp.]